jgi:hypothetical protein
MNIIPHVGLPRNSFPRNFSVKTTVCFALYGIMLCPTHRNLLGPIMTNAEPNVHINHQFCVT